MNKLFKVEILKNKQLKLVFVFVVMVIFLNCPLDTDPVIPPHVDVEGISLNNSNVTLFFSEGEQQYNYQTTLNAVILPAGASNRAVTWKSSDEGVVTVASGVVTAVGAGNAVITVTTDEGEFSAVSAIIVRPLYFYSQFGAVGDGIADDFAAIAATHAAANLSGGKVMADLEHGVTYFIGDAPSPVIIRTDTNWGNANFIIDDTLAQTAGQWVFRIEPVFSSFSILNRGVSTLAVDQPRLFLTPPLEGDALVIAIDNTTLRYRRSNPDTDGTFQRDMFIVDRDGNVDPDTPIIWDFNNISSLMAHPIDEDTLTVTGGRFRRIPDDRNQTGYMNRGIQIIRSNTIIDGIHHTVEDRSPQVRPYNAFIMVSNAANVTIKNSMFTGRRHYQNRGTYDLGANTAVNLNFINSGQTNPITDSAFWGIFGGNYMKNILFDNVSFSRFDAHRGVHMRQ